MRTSHLVSRIVLQLLHDKRTLALILVVPILMLTLISFLLGDSDYSPAIAVCGVPEKISSRVAEEGVSVAEMTLEEGQKAVRDKKLDALLSYSGGKITLLFETGDAVKARLVQKAVQKAVTELLPVDISVDVQYLYGDADASVFDSLGYVMLGIVSFFFVFVIAGVSFVRERTTGTMERLMTTPVRRSQVVLGYTLGFGVFAVIQSVVMLLFAHWVLGMPVAGPLPAAGLIMILLAMSAVCIGAFFSIFSENEFQMMQFIPVVVIPQIFFSGLISLDALPYHLGAVARALPVYYACDALQTVLVRGRGLGGVIPDLLALAGFIALFFFLNILALKRFRRI